MTALSVRILNPSGRNLEKGNGADRPLSGKSCSALLSAAQSGSALFAVFHRVPRIPPPPHTHIPFIHLPSAGWSICCWAKDREEPSVLQRGSERFSVPHSG